MRHELFGEIFCSLALLCVPLAFQLATAAPASLPDGLWLMLVLSIWSALVFLLGLLSLCVRALRLFLQALQERRTAPWAPRLCGRHRPVA